LRTTTSKALHTQLCAAELAYVRVSALVDRKDWHRLGWLRRIHNSLENAHRAHNEHDVVQFLLTAFSLMEWMVCGDERQLMRTDTAAELSNPTGDQLALLRELSRRVSLELAMEEQ
jgi:hypothetical protein